jgi:hypothetical protein
MSLKEYLERYFSINSIDITKGRFDIVTIEASSKSLNYAPHELLLSGVKARHVTLPYHSASAELFEVYIKHYHTADNHVRITLGCDCYYINPPSSLVSFEKFYDNN